MKEDFFAFNKIPRILFTHKARYSLQDMHRLSYKSPVTPFAVAFAPLENVLAPLEISNPDPPKLCIAAHYSYSIPPPPPPQTFSVLCFAPLVVFSEIYPVYGTRLKRPCGRLERFFKSVFARQLHIANRMPSSQYKGYFQRTKQGILFKIFSSCEER